MSVIPLKRARGESDQLPAFNLARGLSTLTAAPPFSFERVLLNIFPLRADVTALESLLSESINIAPDFAQFRPAMPFVMMIVAHYPKMSLEDKNLGWVSSNEITFAIPVEWYEPSGQNWVLHDYAQYSPYIFVDSDASQIEGRQVYGWPKMQGWLAKTRDEWMRDPRRQRTLLRMDSYAFNQGRNEISELLSIRQEAPFSLSVMPPELNGPLNLAATVSDISKGWTGLMRAWSDWATQNAAQLSNPGSISQMLRNAGETMTSFTGNLQANTINLKQFRDSGAPGMACYQAITNASMTVTRVRRSGLLGDQAVFRGDVTGGYEIKLNSYASLPIADSLGLLGDRTSLAGIESTILKPVMPFWQELDLSYGQAQNIAWRAGRVDQGRWRSADLQQQEAPSAPRFVSQAQIDEAGPVPYNTSGSSGYQVAEGPFSFPEAVVIVLPLLADRRRLKELLTIGPSNDPLTGRAMNAEERRKWAMFGQLPEEIAYLEPWGDYVYVIIKHLPEEVSSLNQLGVWSSSLVEFAVPVRWFRKSGGSRELVSCGYVSPFMYSNSDIGSNTARELNGWPSLGSSIESLPNTWLTEGGPFSDHQPLLSLKTSLPAALDSNTRYQWLPLMELIGGNMIGAADAEGWRAAADGWGQRAKQSAEKMYQIRQSSRDDFDDFASIAANLIDRDAFRQFSLKQFRDSGQADSACYQALISSSINVRRVWDMREIEDRLHLNLYRRPTQSIVESLGLKVKSHHQTSGGIVDSLQPVRPFFFKADLEIDNGEKVCSRVGTLDWVAETSKTDTDIDASEEKRMAPIAAGKEFVRSIRWHRQKKTKRENRQNPQNIATKRERWLNDCDNQNQVLDADRISELLNGCHEPQMAIDRILSDEWEHWGLPRWYREWDLHQQIKKLREFREGQENKGVLKAIDVWLEAMEGFPIQQLPPFPLRCDSVGSEERISFPFMQRQPGEFDPQYWSPKFERRTKEDPGSV